MYFNAEHLSKLKVPSGFQGTVTAGLSLTHNTIMQSHLFCFFQLSMLLIVPNTSDLKDPCVELSALTVVVVFFYLFVFRVCFLACTHTVNLCNTNDCTIAIAAQLWNQGNPSVLDASILSLTTNGLCALLTVSIGICLAVTGPVRQQCHPCNTVLTNSLGQHTR